MCPPWYLFPHVFSRREQCFRLGKVSDDPVLLQLPVGEAKVEPGASGVQRNGTDCASGVAVFVDEASLEGHPAKGGGHGI